MRLSKFPKIELIGRGARDFHALAFLLGDTERLTHD